MARVVLHIGAYKTGTSFIQSALSKNTKKLAKKGLLWPGWGLQVQAARELRHSDEGGDSWRRLVKEVDGWSGPCVLLSVEGFSRLKPRSIKTVLDGLSRHEVEVVLTVRDLGRIIPSQWQESAQLRNPWTYREYLDGILDESSSPTINAQFWRRHDYAAILNRWNRPGAQTSFTVITLPPPGAPKSTLWTRFCETAGLVPDEYEDARGANESLGPYSAEFMRQLTRHIEALELDRATRMTLRRRLANDLLPQHRSKEPRLVLPQGTHQWVEQRSQRMIDDLKGTSARIVGDLNDLLPRFSESSADTTDDPSEATSDALMEIAAVALFDLMRESTATSGSESVP